MWKVPDDYQTVCLRTRMESYLWAREGEAFPHSLWECSVVRAVVRAVVGSSEEGSSIEHSYS